jgi:hypothetical protein
VPDGLRGLKRLCLSGTIVENSTASQLVVRGNILVGSVPVRFIRLRITHPKSALTTESAEDTEEERRREFRRLSLKVAFKPR